MPSRACCEEYAALSRRGLFRGAALVGATTVFGSAVVTAAAAAATEADAVLVVLSLRGAADGLSLVVPHSDPVYYQARPADRRTRRAAARPRRHLRAAPGARPAASALERRPARRGPRHRAAGAQPLALRRDGGARGRRSRLGDPARLAEPADRRRRPGVAAPGLQPRRRRAAHLAVRRRPGPLGHRRVVGRDRRRRRVGPQGPAPQVAAHALGPHAAVRWAGRCARCSTPSTGSRR